MFYEVIIGLGVVLYLLWKYLLPRKNEQINTEGCEFKDKSPLDKENKSEQLSVLQRKHVSFKITSNDDEVLNNIIENKPVSVYNLPQNQNAVFESCVELKNDVFKNKYGPTENILKRVGKNDDVDNNGTCQKFKSETELDKKLDERAQLPDVNITPVKSEELVTPSSLLRQQKAKILSNTQKRESPPKERLTEFLEKTILNDDKIQSIIQNLSLDNGVTVSHTQQPTDITKHNIDLLPRVSKESSIHNRAAELQESIDKIADKIKLLGEIDINKVEKKFDEEIPVTKSIHKPPKLPTFSLNFGSVIGELKSKTKNASNGGLKPVFKKFDTEHTDAVDNVQDSLNAVVDDKKKVAIDDNELGPNILADRRNKLETAAQGWRKRVPQTDASLFTVAGRLERDKVTTTTPPQTPPPVPAPTTPSSPGVPSANKFKSRRQHSPTNGFASGPLRSASCAVVSAPEVKPKEPTRTDRESFKRSHSVSESISRVDEKDECSPGAEKSGCTVRVPRADDETFQAFFTPVLNQDKEKPLVGDVEVDLDAIDSGSRQLLASEWARRAKRERRHAASRNPLRALAARTDLREEYSPPPPAARELFIKDKVKCGLAAEALAALASTEDFSNVALRSAAAPVVPSHGIKPLMMLHVKGRRRVQTRLVEPVHTSVNRGDCFVLVTPDQVFLYQGLYANVIERSRSADIALHIHNTKDLGCKNSTAVLKLDEQSHNISNKHWNQFWSLLGVTDDIEEYKPIEAGHPDEDEIYESCIVQTNMCYEVIDDELIPMQEYWGQMPKIEMLHQSKTIVFDYGSEMYIWYGKNVPLEIKRKTAQLAQELFDVGYNYEECHINPLTAAAYQGARETSNGSEKTAKSRPEWSIFSKVTQHMETILFKEKFLDWPDYTRVIQVKPQENKSNGVEIAPCDAEEMFSNEYEDPDLILEGSHIGRGTHYYDKESMRQFEIKSKSLCKWVVREYDYQKVDNDADIGEFFSGDSYIIRWEYQITVSGRELNGKPSKHNVTGRDRCAYFCWQGRDASSNEKGAAALLTVELDKEKGPQVRVAQGNEPSAFLNLFQGNLVIHQGKKGTDRSKYKLFVTRGNVSNEAYLVQVPCSVRQLRSRGSLLLVDTEKGALYIWHGSRSLKHTKNVAIDLANRLIARKSTYLFGDNASDLKIMEVKEGEESKEVLEALGVTNKQYYNSVLGGKEGGGDVTPRLFHLTDAGGQFEANEVLSPLRHEHLVTPFPFEQKELYAASQPALFLLDAGGRVWVWQGWWATEEEEAEAGAGARGARWQALRAAALRTADAYWRVSRGQPEGDADVALVVAGLEPADFTDLFDTWTDHDQAAEANIAHGYKSGEVVSGACELSRLSSVAVLPLAALQRRPLPDHLDSHHLERHLSHADFLTAFGMTKEKFEELPAWKQTNMKKEVGLF